MKEGVILLDMDSTLSDPAHRIKYILNKDYENWNKEAKNDPPNLPVILTVKALFQQYREKFEFIIFTGRTESFRQDTTRWLRKYLGRDFVNEMIMVMRPDGVWTPDHVLKLKWLEQLELPVILAIDDRSSVVKMYRSKEITVLQCAAGDY